MADLKINYGQTIETGKKVSSLNSEFKSLLNKITTTNGNLKTNWEGSDALKYATAVEMQSETMKQLADMVDEIGAFLERVGTAYREACESNASAIKY